MTLIEFKTVDINNWCEKETIYVEHTDIINLTDGWGGGTEVRLKNKDSFTVFGCPEYIEAYIKSTVEADFVTKNPPITIVDVYEAQNKTNEILEKILNIFTI